MEVLNGDDERQTIHLRNSPVRRLRYQLTAKRACKFDWNEIFEISGRRLLGPGHFRHAIVRWIDSRGLDSKRSEGACEYEIRHCGSRRTGISQFHEGREQIKLP